MADTNIFYIDYLDYFVSDHRHVSPQEVWLRYDLLLFADSTLCLSVPACVKLEYTAKLLMKLTDFWNAKRLMLTMDKRHRSNPHNYFNSRMKKLESSMPESKLMDHFEFMAYTSPHSSFFYDVYLSQAVQGGKTLFFSRSRDADICFREAVATQIFNDSEKISSRLPIDQAISINGAFNELLISTQNKREFFQRTLLLDRMQTESRIGGTETKIVEAMLDRGFAYANAVASESIPLSLVKNQFTGRTLARLISVIDNELYKLINELNWADVFTLSNESVWKYFLFCINKILYYVQLSKRYQARLMPISGFDFSLSIYRLITFVYNYVIDNLKEEMFRTPLFYDFYRAEQAFKETMGEVLEHKFPLIFYLKEIDAYLSVVKKTIEAIKRDPPTIPKEQREKGYNFNLVERP